MRVARSVEEAAGFGPSAVTIGNFDGVHAGHRRLFQQVIDAARKGELHSSVLTFDPHPATVVAPARAPRLLTTPEERARLMGEQGIEQVLILPFTMELARLSPEEFVERILVNAMRARIVLVGDNFKFGHKQAGDTRVLEKLGEIYGFKTCIVDAVRCRGRVVSSSEIRRAITQGQVSLAWRLLDRPHALEGEVVPGHGIGSKQTVPTLNIAPSTAMLPANGVYVTRTKDLDDGRTWKSITNIGNRPTFDGDALTIETFLLDPLRDPSPRRIRVELLHRVREERKFEDAGALKAQILRDVGRANVFFRRCYPNQKTVFMPTTEQTTLENLLGDKAEYLLGFKNPKISRDRLHLPGPEAVDRCFGITDRNNRVLVNLQRIMGHGRLRNTGYVSILPVDQGIEHSAGASFAKNPDYFDPENIVKLAVEGGCNAVASTFGVLGAIARKYAHKIPFIVKINHNELLTFPNRFDQVLFGSIKEAYDMGAAAVGATIYFGSDQSTRQIVEISHAFAQAHELGMATVLWCYLRNPVFKTKEKDYHVAADLTGQANHLGVTIEADIIKQKMPENNGGYEALNMGNSSYGKFDERIYTELASDHPVDLCRYQVANCYMGRVGLINSGGASGQHDMSDAVTTAVINKRAGGMGLISGRKAFQRPMKDGIALMNAIQDVYLNRDVTIP